MSLYNKASLIQVPSLYKDGLLVSTVPEDRSGDFAVARGANLSATRIGEDGYIKKGYENLLLQSNTFDTTWIKSSTSVTGGQAGYDGSNDAWLLEALATTAARVEQPIVSNVCTLTIYAKSGTTNWMRLNAGTGGSVYFDLENGVVGNLDSQNIDNSITSVGNGWYKITSVVPSTTHFRVYPATSNGSLATAGDNIYIQDAQLNQGLVAYPYLETTTATVQGGLLENSPRLDWSNGVPAVLVEPSRTNLITQSEYITGTIRATITHNQAISPEGLQNATLLVDSTDANNHQGGGGLANLGETDTAVFSIFAKKQNNRYINLRIIDDAAGTGTGANFYNATFDLENGVVTDDFESATPTNPFSDIEDYGNGWFRCWVGLTKKSGVARTDYSVYLVNSSAAGANPTYAGTGNDGNYLYGAQLEEGSYPTSYIPTYGTSQTRSSETISDNFNIPTTATIYNSFYSDVAETVFVLDQVFDVVVGLNKVAIAFSPTAVKISVGGSIVANATGTYDTSSLTNIQLGSDNGSDYSNAPISGFYVFPEFLTDEELNSLTA